MPFPFPFPSSSWENPRFSLPPLPFHQNVNMGWGGVLRLLSFLLLASSLRASFAQLASASGCPPKTIRIALVCANEDTSFAFCEEQREALFVRVTQENARLSAANVPLTVVPSYHVNENETLSRIAYVLMMQAPTPPDAIIGFTYSEGRFRGC